MAFIFSGNGHRTATPKVHPNLWKPRSGLELMNNDLPSTNPEDSMSCFDLSKNEKYLISATGGPKLPKSCLSICLGSVCKFLML
ncbi:unnamed protein product [Prunus armeniaca]